MDKFIKEAESLKTRLVALDIKSKGLGGAGLPQAEEDEYYDAILDTKILINEFGNNALINELEKHQRFPNPNALAYLLGKLIDTAKFRNR